MKKKELLTLLIVLLFIIICPHIVCAKGIEMNTDKTEIKAGDIVTITIKIKDVGIDEGINSIQGHLIYNKDDWEQVSVEDIKSKNNWSIIYNNEETESEGKFILINFGLGETEEQELVEIKLKSKAKIISKKSEIKLSELYTTDGEKMIEIEDQVKKIDIQGDMTVLLMILLPIIVILVIIVIIISIKMRKRRK